MVYQSFFKLFMSENKLSTVEDYWDEVFANYLYFVWYWFINFIKEAHLILNSKFSKKISFQNRKKNADKNQNMLSLRPRSANESVFTQNPLFWLDFVLGNKLKMKYVLNCEYFHRWGIEHRINKIYKKEFDNCNRFRSL